MKEKLLGLSKKIFMGIGIFFVVVMFIGVAFGEETPTSTDAPNTTVEENKSETVVEEVKTETPAVVEKEEEPVVETNPYKDVNVLKNMATWSTEGSEYTKYVTEISNILVEFGAQDANMFVEGSKMALEQGILEEAIAFFTSYKSKDLPQEIKDANEYYLQSFIAFKDGLTYMSKNDQATGSAKILEASEFMGKGTAKIDEATALIKANNN